MGPNQKGERGREGRRERERETGREREGGCALDTTAFGLGSQNHVETLDLYYIVGFTIRIRLIFVSFTCFH